MWKTVMAGTAALAIAGSSLAMAQQAAAPDATARPDTAARPNAAAPDAAARPDAGQRWRPSADDLAAIAEGRIAQLKVGLRLSADQEKNWPAFEQAMRDAVKARAARWEARRNEQRPTDLIDRMERRAAAMTARAESLKRVADAAKPLYQSLDEGQKHRFAFLIRTMRPHHHHLAFRDSEHGSEHGWRGSEHGWRGPERGWREPDDDR